MGDDAFKRWMRRVDEEFALRADGLLSRDDIPDWGYWDAFADGLTPSEAADAALAEAGWRE